VPNEPHGKDERGNRRSQRRGRGDTPHIQALGFACFRRYHSPLTARWQFDIAEFHVPIRIGGVAIAPGDFILGDIDGVLIIPAAVADGVIDKALSVCEREDVVRAALDQGASVANCSTSISVLRSTGGGASLGEPAGRPWYPHVSVSVGSAALSGELH